MDILDYDFFILSYTITNYILLLCVLYELSEIKEKIKK